MDTHGQHLAKYLTYSRHAWAVDSLWHPTTLSEYGGLQLPVGWNKVGWFRCRFRISAPAQSQSLALHIFHAGASEIYVNGKLMRTYGVIHADGSYTDYNPQRELLPLDPYLVRGDTSAIQTIAIRLASEPDDESPTDKPEIPLSVSIGPTSDFMNIMMSNTSRFDYLSLIPFGMIVALGLLHILLYAFDSRQTVHLWYFIFACCLSVIFSCWHIQMTTTSAMVLEVSSIVLNIMWSVIVFVAMILISMVFYGTVRRVRIVVAATITVAVLVVPWFLPALGTWLWAGFVVLATADVANITIRSIRSRQEGAWMIGLGLLMFSSYLLSWFLTARLGLFTMEENVSRGVFVMGITSMPLCITLFLARRITGTNRDLRMEIKKNLELAAEQLAHERQSRELEEARKLQMSMLPTTMPVLVGLEASMAMHTATEVGGDYFDYHVNTDGSVTFALGDATGHGLKAGVMVAVTKSYFQTHAGTNGHHHILHHTSDGIRQLRLRGLYMCLGLLTVKGQRVTWTSAGIPPVLHVQANGTVVPYLVRSLPLGSPIDSFGESLSFDVRSGDYIVMYTDGLPELFNPEFQTLGMAAIEDCLRANTGCSAKEITSALTALAESWRADQPYNDDVSIVVLQFTENIEH